MKTVLINGCRRRQSAAADGAVRLGASPQQICTRLRAIYFKGCAMLNHENIIQSKINHCPHGLFSDGRVAQPVAKIAINQVQIISAAELPFLTEFSGVSMGFAR